MAGGVHEENPEIFNHKERSYTKDAPSDFPSWSFVPFVVERGWGCEALFSGDKLGSFAAERE
jgi:hypothetical protein